MYRPKKLHPIIPHPIPPLSPTATPSNCIEVAGIQVEVRYKADAPSLQQQVIQLCNQSLEM